MGTKKLIIAGFSLITFLVMGAAGITYHYTHASLHGFSSAVNLQYQKQYHVVQMHLAARSYVMYTQQVMLTDDEFEQDDIRMESYQYARSFNRHNGAFKAIMNEDDAAWIEQVGLVTGQASKATKRALALFDEGEFDKATDMFQHSVFPMTKAFEVLIKKNADEQGDIINDLIAEQTQSVDALVNKVIFISLVVVLFSLLIAFGVGRKIVHQSDELLSWGATLEARVAERTTEISNIQASLIENNNLLNRVIREDELTGILNRKGMLEQIEINYGYFKTSKKCFSLLFLDIDFFKSINDQFGHEEGDRVLKIFTQKIQKSISQSFVFGRWGGEEFLVLCPSLGLDEAVEVANDIRFLIESTPIIGRQGVTVSIGVAEVADGDSINSLLNRADQGLYKAKKTGRNKVVASSLGD